MNKPKTPLAPLPAEIFHQAVEEADIAITITDPEANVLYVNPAFTRVTGYAAAEMVGRNQSLLSNKTTPRELYKQLWDTIVQGLPWSGQLVNRRKDRTKYLADVAITPVHDADGRIVNFLGLHRDMTELHRLECQVLNQKGLIESVVANIPAAVALIDANDNVVLDNQAHRHLVDELGLAAPAVQLFNAIRSELGLLQFPQPGQFADNRAFVEREVRIDSPDLQPTRWFSCSGVWVTETDDRATAFFTRESRTYLLLLAIETTATRMQQQRLHMSMLQASMAEEDRINDLRETLSAAAFQLEGPLNVMTSAIALLRHRDPNDPMAAALGSAVKSGTEAVQHLRTVIPAQRAESEIALNVNELLREVIEMLTPRLLAAGIRVAWNPQQVLPAIHGHPNKLRSMIKALLDNAIDAMNTRGWRERDLLVATQSLPDGIEIRIEDSGPGIAPELQLRVFEPFFTTRAKEGRHLGIGLASAQQIVVDHCGSIEIDPNMAKGCRVLVTLPQGGKKAS